MKKEAVSRKIESAAGWVFVAEQCLLGCAGASGGEGDAGPGTLARDV